MRSFKTISLQTTPTRPTRLCVATLLLASLMMSASGCAQFVLIGYLLGGPPSIEPDFDAMTGESMQDPEKIVAVVCYAPTELKWDFEDIDAEVAKFVSFRLGEHNIRIVHPDVVRAWLDENPDWEQPEEIGREFEADYVIEVELTAFSLFEKDSTVLFRGRTEAYINVVSMDDTGDGDKIYTKELNSVFPTQIPRSIQDGSYLSFKREYLSRLSEEIGWLFYERYNGDKIAWAT